MAQVCDTRYYILSLIEGTTNEYNVWDKVDKNVVRITYSSVYDFYELNPGSIIDVVQLGGLVALAVKSSTVVVEYIYLPSTSGDYYNTLLSATATSGVLTVVMYASTAREVTTLTFSLQTQTNDSPPEQITPCFNDFELTDGSVITQWCEGTTLKQVIYTQSPAGITEESTPNSPTCGYVPPPETNIRVTEIKSIDFETCIPKNPVYFVWKNTLGGWDYWLFGTTQSESLQTESLGSFSNDYNRIGDITNPETEIGKEARKRIVYTALQLTDVQKNGLLELMYSNKVYILNQDGSINRQVKILPGSFQFETKNTLHELTFEILDTPINTIKN